MDDDVQLAVEQAHMMAIIKAIGRIVVVSVFIISVSAYGCERIDGQAQANRPPCKTYVCTDK